MITSLSPLDGRYSDKINELAPYFSEFGLIKHRVIVELSFFMALSAEPKIKELPPLSDKELKMLDGLMTNFDETHAQRIKAIEKTTNHDVKAVEYFIKENLKGTSLNKYLEFVHFACTSEDINNLSYGMMLKGGTNDVMLPTLEELVKTIEKQAGAWKSQSLLSLTHGQPATPTTVGKELLNVASRLKRQIKQLKGQEYLGKLNGATGNFSAHSVAYSEVDWPKFAKKFVENLGLTYNPLTTQIEPHDYMAELFDNIARINTILIDFNRDVWGYISRGIFKQKVVAGEVGSSTMPHKVNPIDFENAEGNLGMANAMLRHFAEKLPISRYQRDLTDSTVQRSIGVAFGYSLLAYKSTLKGLSKLELNKAAAEAELDSNWELLAEPIQTVLRKYQVQGAYEKLKELTRGKRVTKESLAAFIDTLEIPKEEKAKLKALTPSNYVGLAKEIK
jgi:adenylosuccinate lyase